jgi:hypothetical protein
MNWFRANKFLGSFLIAFGLATLIAASLLLSAKSGFDQASDQFNQTATEFNRLQRLNPFPNQANLLTMKAQAADYGVALGKLKDELRTFVLPVTPMAPNEFQARLRQTVTAVFEKARANKVKLPGNFFLGFDEFASALPSNTAAPLLGQQLAQVKLLIDILIDARIDALTAFKRGPLPEEHAGSATPTPAPSRGRKSGNATAASEPKLVERSIIEATFASSPTAARRVINQIASANKQFYIIRTLHVLNQKEKGPPRAQAADSTNAPATPNPSPGAKPGALTFIVGTEHIQTSASVELIRFTF